jgi:TRAP transporter 4TM/12TM fusion protein
MEQARPTTGHVGAVESLDESVKLDQLPKWLGRFGVSVAICLSLFQLYTSLTGIYKTSMIHYSIHLLLVLVIFFSTRKPLCVINRHFILLDIGIIAATTYALGYVATHYDNIMAIVEPSSMSGWQASSAWLITLLVLYAVFRINRGLFVFSILSIVYALFGNVLPGAFQHAGLDVQRLVYLISFSSDGIYGTALSVSATYLFLFIFFGFVLEKTGTGSFFIDASQSLVGRFTGGSAKTALFASAGLGSVVGSSIGNVVAAGSLTIPLMKKTGFRAHVAAAIESVASEGGQLLPPVLGAGAFIMAEITGIPYGEIALAATIPAILYFVSIFFVIDFEARKFNLRGLSKEELPVFRNVLLEKGHLVFSIVLLFYLLVFQDMSATKAGFFSILGALFLAMLRKSTRFGWKDFLEMLKGGGEAAVEIAIICATMGIIAGVVVFTGIGVRLSEIILGYTGQNLILTLIAAMVISIILGMGLPTPVAYLISALFVAPALIDLGVPILAAHMFLFFFAIKSGVTPPVAIVAVVAAGIAKANWFKTAVTGTLYSLPSFIIAYMFVLEPSLLLKGEWYWILFTSISATIGVIGFAGAIQGWWLRKLTVIERIMFTVLALMLISPTILFSLIGVGGILILTLVQYFSNKKRKVNVLNKIQGGV